MRTEGDERGLLVAPDTPMRSEYRIFLVAGVPVTGAACIESHTPLDRGSSDFDAVVEGKRGNLDTRYDPVLVGRYITEARRIGALLEAEGRGNCVLDLALGPGGEIVIIEINALLNAGLYASNPLPGGPCTARAPGPHDGENPVRAAPEYGGLNIPRFSVWRSGPPA